MVPVLKKEASKQEMKEIEQQMEQLPASKSMQARDFCGVISLKEDPLAIQKKLRDEW